MPRQDPCRDTRKALTEDASGATSRPALAKSPPPFACSCQPNQLGRHLCGGMQIFVETYHCATSAACLPTWRCMHHWPGRVSKQGEVAADGTGLVPVPNKARGHLSDALNASCLNTSDKLVALYAFPPPVCHCGSPFRLQKEAHGVLEKDSALWNGSATIGSWRLKNTQYIHQSRTRVLRILAARTWVNDPHVNY